LSARWYTAWANQGRWGMLVYRKLLLPGIEYPFISCAVGLFFLSLAYTLWASFHEDATPAGKLIFGCLAISFPTFAHVQQFSFMGAFIACSVFLTFCAYLLSSRANTVFAKYVLPVFLLTFVASTHQSVIYIFFAPFLVDILIASIKGRLSIRGVCIDFCKMMFIATLAIVLYFVADRILKYVFSVESSGYVEGQLLWGHLSFTRMLINVFSAAGRFFQGKEFSYMLVPLAAIPVLCVLAASKRKILTAFGILVILAYCIFYHVVFGQWQPSRSMMFLPVIWGGLFYAAFVSIRPVGKTILLLVAIFSVLFHASIITQLYMTDTFARQRDMLITTRIMENIYDVAPDFASQKIPVAFIGRIANTQDSFFSPADREVFGGSFWQWGRGNSTRIRMRAYLLHMGVPAFNELSQQKAERLAGSEDVLGMPAWPAQGFVQMHDGVLVVKLSN
jgi:hypothetical protein